MDSSEIALRYHCRLAIETIHPRFASVDRARGFTIVFTVNSGYE